MKYGIYFFILLLIFLIYRNNKSSFNNDSLKIHIINPPGKLGEERRKYIKKVFDKADMEYIFSGYHKEKIDKSRYSKYKRGDLSDGQIALSMAHNDLYKQLLDSNDNFMIIGEDDCTFRPNFKIYLNKVINSLPSDFDMVKLEYIKDPTIKYNTDDNDDVPRDDNAEIKYFKDSFYPGTACYIISRKGAEYFLKLNEPIWLQSDGILEEKWQKEKMDRTALIYYTDPPLSWQGNVKQILY